MLNLAILGGHILDALNRHPAASNSVELLVNEAGTAWCNANAWGYLRRRRREVVFVAGQASYPLGADLVEVQSITDLAQRGVCPLLVTRSEFETQRAVGGGIGYGGAWVGTVYDGLDGGVAQKLLEVFPTPTATQTIVLIYTGGWARVNESEEPIDLPQQLEPAFIEWVRHYAMGREAKMPMAEAIALAQASPIVRDAMAREGRETPFLPASLGRVGVTFRRAAAGRFSDPNPYGPNLARPWGWS